MAYYDNAVPTVYNGVRFRSLLEARWATLFDELGIKWEYEPARFKAGDGWYRPDFALDGVDMYAECKPELPPAEMAPHERLWDAYLRGGGTCLVLLTGVPRVRWYRTLFGWDATTVIEEYTDLSQVSYMGHGYSNPAPQNYFHDRERFVAAVRSTFQRWERH